MPINKLQGLRGLRGLGELSEGERKKFYADNASVLSKYSNNPMRYGIAAERLYNNQKFINKFGESAFDQLNDGSKASYDRRNQMFFDATVMDAYQERFGKIGTNPYNDQIAAQLDTQGMYDLLNNEEYLGPYKRNQLYQKNLNAAKKVGKSFDASINNPYVDALTSGWSVWGKTESANRPNINLKDLEKRDEEILNKLKAETQQRREAEIQDDADIIYANMLNADDSGNKSLAQSYKEFDAFATKNSPHYATFKNSKWMKDYANEDRLKDYAKYLALKQRYGEGVALNYFERGMQNRIAEAQDGKWTGNTLKGLLTTTWSDLGSNVALFANVGKSADQMAILNQGKDPNKPIYDKKGNIVDYQRNDDWVTNPAYWNNVYKYNTFSPTEIKAIEERGGISEDVNVREFGYTPDFFSWDTMEEGFKQGGHVLAAIAETALTGSLGKGIGWAGKGAMKVMGLSAKAAQTASKAGRIANNILVGATTGLEGSQLEAMGTFDDQMQSGQEKIQKQITKELTDYQRSINYNSNAAKLGINNIYRQLKAQDSKRVALGNREGSKAFPLSDETLRAQAKQLYTNQLLEDKQKELQELHKKDELEVAKAAQKAYTTNFWMDYIKNVPLTVGIQKFKIAKGSMRSMMDNTIKDNLIADVETGGVKRTTKRFTSGKNLSKAIAKQFVGGFADEYLDGLNASFSSGVDNNEFDNYIKRNYDPKAYNATVDTFLGNTLAGMSEGIDGITDRQNLYEGFIGMISPLATATVNPNAAFRPKDTWKAVVGGKDAYGNKIGKLDRMSTVLMNPLLDTMSEAREKDAAINNAANIINAVVAANKDKVQDASRAISVLGNYEGTLQGSSLLDAKDNKLLNAFTLIDMLNDLENIGGGVNSKFYKDNMETIEGLANDTLSKEQLDHEIDVFLADDNNKSVLDDADRNNEDAKAKARDEAAKKLKANAKYFLEMKDKLSKINNLFNNSASLKDTDPRVKTMLAYNIVASDDYKKRLESIEEKLNLGKTDTESLYKPDFNLRYTTPQSRNKAIAARERQINKIQKELDDIQKEREKIQVKLNASKESLKTETDDKKVADLRNLVNKQQNSLDGMKFHEDSLREQKKMLSNEKEEIAKATGDTAFDENIILNADARDRAFIFDPKNRGNFSEGKQAIIENIANTLMQDPEALAKIKDAATLAHRIEDMRNIYGKILKNDKLAEAYLDAVGNARDRAAMAESLEREIDKSYVELGDAYINSRKDPDAFKLKVLGKSPELIEAYMEDHSNQANAFKPYYDMLVFDRNAGAIINESDYTEEAKQAMRETLLNMNASTNSKEELEKALEGIIDSPDVDASTKERIDYLMSKMQELGYQRDATTLSNRKERQRKQEEERKKKEEEEKKAVEEAKAAADKKAEEEKKTSSEELGQDLSTAMIDAETPDVSGSMSTDEISKSVTPDVDTSHSEDELRRAAENSGIDTSMSEEELRKSAIGEEIPLDLTSTPKEKGGTSRLGQLSQLMSDTTKEGDEVKLGNDIIAERTPNQIIFNLDKGDESKVPVTLNITPDEYETNKDSLKDDKKTSFEASYLRKEGDDWYFVGNFAGSDKKTKVKAKNTSIENQALQQKKGSVAKEETHPTDELVYKDDAAEGNSPSIEKQYEEATAEGNDNVHISDTNEDSAETNGTGEFKINNDATTLTANSMSLYESGVLATKGILQRKKGAEEGDRRNTYYAWMDAAGIKLQNIIDNELARIIQRNPHAKVKFMGVKPERNATNDYDMFEHLMLVLDYDDKVNEDITSIHDDSNGGVIESDGKKYLIIGVAGYGDRNLDKRALYFRLWSPQDKSGFRLKTQRKKFFDKHPNERFYVNQELSTEVVPYSLIPGYIVKQTEKDSEPNVRSVSELLADKERNPHGITMEKAAWGIQEMSKFLLVNATPDQVMVPRNALGNMGSAFVLMPASNGKLVPSYLRVLKYSEMNDGALKERIDKLLQEIIAPNYDKAIQAIVALHNLLYLNSKGDDILRRKTKDEVSLVHDGEIVRTFVLDSNFERPEFIKAFETDVNPRVNITARVLNNPELLRQYDEAGALMTDVALFGTAGSSYSVYGLDGNGDMIIPKAPINETAKSKNSSDFKNSKSQVIYNHQYYVEDNGVYSLNGKTITDEKLLEQLKYNKMIVDSELIPALTKGTMDYFILSTGEHPNVIKVNQNTKEVKELSEKAAKDLIEKVNEKKAKEQREEEAENAMDDSSKIKVEELEEAPLDMGNDFEIDPNTGGMITTQPKKEKVKVEEKEETPKEDKPTENALTNKTVENLSSAEQKEGTQKFTDLMRDMRYLMEIRRVIKKKWENAPKGINDLTKFLKEKDIEVDAIGTSEADIQAWIKTVEDCR